MPASIKSQIVSSILSSILVAGMVYASQVVSSGALIEILGGVSMTAHEKMEHAPSTLPAGTIVAWRATTANVENPSGNIIPPKGWLICNGHNNTPDLIDRFIYGADRIEYVAQSGGSLHHDHQGRTGQGGHRRGVDNDTDHYPSAHEHTHSINEDKHLPPFVKLVYIMKKPAGEEPQGER